MCRSEKTVGRIYHTDNAYIQALDLLKSHCVVERPQDSDQGSNARDLIPEINEKLMRAEDQIDHLVLNECSEINLLNPADRDSIHNWIVCRMSIRESHPSNNLS